MTPTCDRWMLLTALHQNTEKALVMLEEQNLLFVIADGDHVRFVRQADGDGLQSVATLEPCQAHKRSSGCGSDNPGAASARALAQSHDLYALEKAKLGRAVAAWLNAAAAANTFEDLVIVAPPHTLIAIRQRLNAATDAKVVGTLTKDLAHTPDAELWPHLRWWLKPNPRARS